MLMELNIRDFALIDRMKVEFSHGLNVLTGETGAGKSIVVDALTLALGGRADKEMIRTGCQRAVVQAVFDLEHADSARACMAELDLPCEEDCLILEREMGSRNICRINGSAVPLSNLKKLAACLCELHGQHENHSLLTPTRHLGILDIYGDEAHRSKIDLVANCHEAYAKVQRALEKLETEMTDRERRLDNLTRECDEIAAAKIKSPDEDELLEKKFRLMQNSEKISAAVEKAYRNVYEGTERSPSAQEQLQRAASAVRGLADLDERFDALSKRLDELYYSAQDIGYELRDILDGLDFDAARFDKIGVRLSNLDKLKRKYGPKLSDVLSYLENGKKEIERLSDADNQTEKLRKEESAARSVLLSACAALHKSRHMLSAGFEASVTAHLADLGMSRARFSVRLVYEPGKMTANGADECEFYFTANPGEPPRPLSSTASGGELSRVMLSIKAVMAERDGVDAMVFDEIDTGVSGRMAQTVGEKLAAIARTRQVIAVSHLPQITALADQQYLVEKIVEDEHTGTNVRLLDRNGRAEVLSQMIGGAEDRDTALAHAFTLLESADKWKADYGKNPYKKTI